MIKRLKNTGIDELEEKCLISSKGVMENLVLITSSDSNSTILFQLFYKRGRFSVLQYYSETDPTHYYLLNLV